MPRVSHSKTHGKNYKMKLSDMVCGRVDEYVQDRDVVREVARECGVTVLQVREIQRKYFSGVIKVGMKQGAFMMRDALRFTLSKREERLATIAVHPSSRRRTIFPARPSSFFMTVTPHHKVSRLVSQQLDYTRHVIALPDGLLVDPEPPAPAEIKYCPDPPPMLAIEHIQPPDSDSDEETLAWGDALSEASIATTISQ